PQRAEIAAVPDAAVMLAGYTGREDRSEGEAFDPTPENIENRVVRFELANGTEVALLPKATRGERVRGVMTTRMGNLDALMSWGAVPNATASMLSRGTQQYTRQQLNDQIDLLQAGLNIGGGASLVTASVDTRRENLMAVIDLVAEVAKHPTFPESELEEFKRQSLTSINQQLDNPTSVASRALNRHLNTVSPEHPEYAASFDESRQRIEALTSDQLHAYHKRFYGMGPGSTIAFVGDFDPDELRAKLEAQFGDWNRQEAFDRYDRVYEFVDAERLVEQMDDKANAFLFGSQPYAMRQDDPDYPALMMAGHLMGGGFLSSRLGNRIRNEEGLSYAVGGGFSAGAIDELGRFFVYAAFAPENRERLEAVLAEELDKVITDGFTEDELESGRTGFLQQRVLSRSDDAALASLLSNSLYLDRDLFYEADMDQRFADVSLEDVNAAVRRWLKPEDMSVAIAGDLTAE
ncbi:MAG: pitrilysin family protein, partial [Pseudomonadota bacterium]